MIARSFKSVVWVAAIGAAALICYMFSLRVAEERASLAQLQTQIGTVQRSIRTLNTELGTRGRVQQLQHWASADFGFGAPGAGQFLDGEVRLAQFEGSGDVPGAAAVRLADARPAAPAVPHVIQASAQNPVRPAQLPAQAVVRQIRADAATSEASLVHRAAVVREDAPATAPRSAPRAIRSATPAPAAAPAKPRARTAGVVNPRTLRTISARAQAENGASTARRGR